MLRRICVVLCLTNRIPSPNSSKGITSNNQEPPSFSLISYRCFHSTVNPSACFEIFLASFEKQDGNHGHFFHPSFHTAGDNWLVAVILLVIQVNNHTHKRITTISPLQIGTVTDLIELNVLFVGSILICLSRKLIAHMVWSHIKSKFLCCV